MNEEILQQLVEKISTESFRRPFLHQATWNRRLQTSGGRYKLATHNLDFNPKLYEKYGETLLIQVIKHELCHYHLHLEGKGYRHRDKEFRQLLKNVGGTRFVPELNEATLHLYTCVKCGQIFKRKRRMNVKKYACGKCRGRLEETKTREEHISVNNVSQRENIFF